MSHPGVSLPPCPHPLQLSELAGLAAVYFVRVLLAKTQEPHTLPRLELERNEEQASSPRKATKAESDKHANAKKDQARLHISPGPASQASLGHLRLHVFDECFEFAAKHFMERKTCSLHPSFFVNAVQRFPVLAWRIVPMFSRHAEQSANHFRWQGAYSFLLQLLKQKSFNESHPEIVAAGAQPAVSMVATIIGLARRDKAKPKLTKPLGQALMLLTKTIVSVTPETAAAMKLQAQLEQLKTEAASDASPVFPRATELALETVAPGTMKPKAKKAKRAAKEAKKAEKAGKAAAAAADEPDKKKKKKKAAKAKKVSAEQPSK